MGIRLNRRAPDISFKKKKTGGVGFNSVVPLTKVDEKMCLRVLAVSRFRIRAASPACLTVSGLAACDLMSAPLGRWWSCSHARSHCELQSNLLIHGYHHGIAPRAEGLGTQQGGCEQPPTADCSLQEYKIHNADVLFREDATIDDFIDVIEGNRRYTRCLYVYNKVRRLHAPAA